MYELFLWNRRHRPLPGTKRCLFIPFSSIPETATVNLCRFVLVIQDFVWKRKGFEEHRCVEMYGEYQKTASCGAMRSSFVACVFCVTEFEKFNLTRLCAILCVFCVFSKSRSQRNRAASTAQPCSRVFRFLPWPETERAAQRLSCF